MPHVSRTKEYDERLYRSDLQCCVQSITYEPQSRMGVLFLPDLNSPDMSGCIRLFTAIDPLVNLVMVIEAGGFQVAYFKRRDGEWDALSQ